MAQPASLRQCRLATAAAALLAACGAAAQPLAASRLRVEYLDRPLAVEAAVPRFSWAVAHTQRAQAQSQYRLVVAAAPGGAVVWDSAIVASNVSTNVAYGGPPLPDDSDFVLTVAWWDARGVAAPTAETTFSTGLVARASWAGAAFIGGALQPGSGGGAAVFSNSDNMLRAEVVLAQEPVRARLYVAGAGYFRAWVNGAPTDSHVLGPFTTFESRLLYDTADVTPLLHQGCNGLGVMLGAGWFAQPTVAVGNRSFAALLSVTLFDGSKVLYYSALASSSGAHGGAGNVSSSPLLFTSAASPVTSDDIYAGESYDARLAQPGFATCGYAPAPPLPPWRHAVAASPDPLAGGAELSAHAIPVGVDRVYSPANITEPLQGVFVIDFSQNLAGQEVIPLPQCWLPQRICWLPQRIYPNNPPPPPPHHRTQAFHLRYLPCWTADDPRLLRRNAAPRERDHLESVQELGNAG